MAGTRPTKKQRELLTFIEQFISQHGYSPSYREIMSGLHYTSVSTVSVHVNNLIRRGQLRKRDRSARSVELATGDGSTNAAIPVGSEWLVTQVEQRFRRAEKRTSSTGLPLAELEALVASLRILGLDEPAQAFTARLARLAEHEAPPAPEEAAT